ncbi:hypothetical protein FB45DRAFT_931722 [Roridomyces roridus]|uniref:Uncharacterized protein n=1 Tax=Roridomyces roridus TaxID=1738132 RepID=A0AAD7FG60_9AGAR|nr:hypothetical protein FB45DRAFT_931722 [Roridomyces roridus]
MPVLAPSLNPPGSSKIQTTTLITIPDPAISTENEEPQSDGSPSTVSRVTFDFENISDALAAHLAANLVGHVLFLKSQVPFPVLQLEKIPNGKTNPRALKLRTELLASFDTLSSHLGTTFSALSTAFALTTRSTSTTTPVVQPTRRAYLAIVVGPSIGSAKTRVMFAVDGLVARVWGERDDLPAPDSESSDEEDSDEDGDEEESEGEEEEPSDTESSDAASPPPSRSPSPCGAQTQATLRTANRLLSHALATAEHSMLAELAPSQTHILLRAPRRFAHPAWIPRQTASNALDRELKDFRVEAGDLESPAAPKKTHGRNKAKVEGAWIACRVPGIEFLEQEGKEEDEMIWWSWDGKLVGFADW